MGDQQRRDIVGIWGPEEGGCASGFGLAFTPGGRFAMGDEYMGEEGTWQIRDGRLTQTITLAYEKQDDIGAPQATSVSRSYSYVIRQLDARRLAMDNESYAVALIRCPDGRRMFMDGERFP